MVLKRLGCALILAVAVCAPIAAAADAPLGVGKPAPAIDLENLSGKKISLAQFKGKPVFVNFFASWCQPCKLELPFIVKQYPALKAKAKALAAGVLAFLASPRGLAPSRAGAAADSPRLSMRACRRLEVVKLHAL